MALALRRCRCAPPAGRPLEAGDAVRENETAPQQVHGGAADERGDEDVGRPLVDLVRGAELLEPAAVHDGNEVGKGESFRLVMGDVDEGLSKLLVQALQLAPHGNAQGHVEVAQWFVHQEHGRLADDGAAQRHPLALSSGKLPRPAVEQLGDSESPGGLPHPALYLGRVHLHHAQRETHVAGDAHVRIQRVALEDHGDVAAVGRKAGDVFPVEGDAALGDRFEPGDQPQAGGLAAP